MGVNGDTLQLHAVYEKLCLLLQVTSEHAMKLKVLIIKSLSPEYQAIPEKYHLFVAVGIVSRAMHS